MAAFKTCRTQKSSADFNSRRAHGIFSVATSSESLSHLYLWGTSTLDSTERPISRPNAGRTPTNWIRHIIDLVEYLIAFRCSEVALSKVGRRVKQRYQLRLCLLDVLRQQPVSSIHRKPRQSRPWPALDCGDVKMTLKRLCHALTAITVVAVGILSAEDLQAEVQDR